jgi:hypothetical protein
MRKLLIIAICFFAMMNCVNAQWILTPSGYRLADSLKVGDNLVSYDLKTGEPLLNTITEVRVMNPEFYLKQKEKFEFFIFNGKYKFFRDQTVFANHVGLHAFEIKVGDTIYKADKTPIIVKEIKKTGGKHWVKFTVDGDHSYIDDGILVHNAARYWVGQSGGGNYNSTIIILPIGQQLQEEVAGRLRQHLQMQ